MTPGFRRPDWSTAFRPTALVIAVAALVAATTFDGWAYRALVVPDVYDHDWGRMLRVVGFLPTWAVVSAALAISGPASGRTSVESRWRAWLPLLAATVGGLAAEVLKLLLRRERPEAHAGVHVFRSWLDHPLSTSGLALPSSHALVAFAAAAMLARLYPRARWLWYALAAGCALTRVLARAHFLSDVTLAAIVGWAVAAVLWHGVNSAKDPHRGTATEVRGYFRLQLLVLRLAFMPQEFGAASRESVAASRRPAFLGAACRSEYSVLKHPPSAVAVALSCLSQRLA
jgi:membrane-associated phospholipid phosphatase